ncbi:MAG: glycosyltransferase [Verrucomicrobia bacterium]|nr:glycosyltransferase [Verrucomicrobiota bacterium]
MRFSIVTPSFRGAAWLKLCIASVADQGVDLEHIVQDACSDDGTGEWLPHDPRVKAFIEKDRGMYDAVNRGLRRSRGDILAYLNCDEQYLPHALAQVDAYFRAHPEIEVAFADSMVVDPAGAYMCHRRSSLPGKAHTWIGNNLSILTAATFFRRSLIEQRQLFFEDSLRDVADAVWVLQLLRHNVRLGLLPRLTSVFTETGDNMNLKPNAQREKKALNAQAPPWLRAARPAVLMHYRLRRLLAGHYWPAPPFDYAIFTRTSPDRRATFHVAHPTFQYRRLALAPSAGPGH